jgi:hypothetical protein
MPTKQEFEEALKQILRNAREERIPYIDLWSKELHSLVGGYPGPKHNMPSCCTVMRENMNSNDKVLEQPKKGNGANLLIRYYL